MEKGAMMLGRLILLGLFVVTHANGFAADSLEKELLELAGQAQFTSMKKKLIELPQTDPLRVLLETHVIRLSRLQKKLHKTINSGDVKVQFREVFPLAVYDGEIIGATTRFLKIQGKTRIHRSLWAGLPGSVILVLMKKFLKVELMPKAALYKDLCSALALGSESRNLIEGKQNWIPLIRNTKERLMRGELDQAKTLLDHPELSRHPNQLWIQLCRNWLKRLQLAKTNMALRRAKALQALPTGSKLMLWSDFEQGPELTSNAWQAGNIDVNPDKSELKNRWVMKAAHFDEPMGVSILEIKWWANMTGGPKPKPILTLNKNQFATFRVWVDGSRSLELWFWSSKPKSTKLHVGRQKFKINKESEWVTVNLPISDLRKFEKVRPYKNLRKGYDVWHLDIKVIGIKNEGRLYMDDLKLYSQPVRKIAAPPPVAEDDEESF